MTYIFLLTFFLSIVALIGGLIKPSIFKRVIKVIPKRKTVAIVCSAIIIVSFFGIGITAPQVEKSTTNEIASIESEAKESAQVNEIEVIAENKPDTTIDGQAKTESQQPQNIQTIQIEKTTTIPTPATQNNSQYEYYSVSSIVDGDTLKVNINGTVETLRLIGLDTPETVDPRKPVQCFGKEASAKTKELLEGKRVRLEKDVSETDKYDRLLRYVYLEDGTFINELLVREGYASASSYPPDVKYQDQFRAAEQTARANRWGLWSDLCASPEPVAEIPAISAPAVVKEAAPVKTEVSKPAAKAVSCSSDTYNCGDFKTCSDVMNVFNACPGDPHGLDGNDDGVPCEKLCG